jgi:hypothetical protein
MAEKLWTSYDSQSQLTFSDKLLVSCSNETKNTTMNDIYNYICSSSGSTGDYQYRINANLVGGIPVTSNTPNDGAILQYNSTYQRWDLIYLTNAGKIRDINVSPATPTDGQVLVYSESGSQYYPADIGGTYTLPTASTTELGGVKVDGTTITINNGVISSSGGGGGGGGSDELWYPTYDAVTGDLSWAKSDSSTTPASAHIKGADGADGLSAYASAQLGGYTDTEAAFYADLAAMQGLDAALEALL